MQFRLVTPKKSLIPISRVNANTLAKLRSLPNPRYNPLWPEGTKQPLTKQLAEYFFSLVSTCDTSLLQLLREHPELPHFKQLDNWRRRRSWFAEGWKHARQNQAHFLANQCLEMAKTADPKTAHVVRVKFDILRWFASKLHPNAYGDKPPAQQQTTNVQIGLSLSPERLTEIRSKLDQTRTALQQKPKDTEKHRERHLSTSSGLTNDAPSLCDRKKEQKTEEQPKHSWD